MAEEILKLSASESLNEETPERIVSYGVSARVERENATTLTALS